jgi:hypothetical protein
MATHLTHDQGEVANVEAFDALAAAWRREKGRSSSAARMAQHPAYRRIVEMGAAAVPFILRELERRPDHWFIALHEITGEDPVPTECRGNVKAMAEAWLNWGREKGYKWNDGS